MQRHCQPDSTRAIRRTDRKADGWRILGMSWQPDVERGTVSPASLDAAIARMRALLGVNIEVEYCPHLEGPPRCWCRKPLPGLGVALIRRHRLDPARCSYVGSGSQDPGFARRLGFQYRDATEFFTPTCHKSRAG